MSGQHKNPRYRHQRKTSRNLELALGILTISSLATPPSVAVSLPATISHNLGLNSSKQSDEREYGAQNLYLDQDSGIEFVEADRVLINGNYVDVPRHAAYASYGKTTEDDKHLDYKIMSPQARRAIINEFTELIAEELENESTSIDDLVITIGAIDSFEDEQEDELSDSYCDNNVLRHLQDCLGNKYVKQRRELNGSYLDDDDRDALYLSTNGMRIVSPSYLRQNNDSNPRLWE